MAARHRRQNQRPNYFQKRFPLLSRDPGAVFAGTATYLATGLVLGPFAYFPAAYVFNKTRNPPVHRLATISQAFKDSKIPLHYNQKLKITHPHLVPVDFSDRYRRQPNQRERDFIMAAHVPRNGGGGSPDAAQRARNQHTQPATRASGDAPVERQPAAAVTGQRHADIDIGL